MNDLSTYRAALQCKTDIERIHARASLELRAISGGGPMGLTPDRVKQSLKWQAASSCFNYWHAKLQQFNRAFMRQYGAQYRADMRARRNGESAQ